MVSLTSGTHCIVDTISLISLIMYLYHHCISVPLAAVFLGNLAKPFSPRWDDIRTKLSWNAVPKNWESLGQPPSGTTIDFYIALKRAPWSTYSTRSVDPGIQGTYGAYLHREQVAKLVVPHPSRPSLLIPRSTTPSSSVSTTHGSNTLTVKGIEASRIGIGRFHGDAVEPH
ncbi:hypothetical protein H4582DRAFT_2215685 [Lactarius indigo]|nr:hypothetical protein H4582DRAFT_2215685 [Lactarius indigo]